MSVAEQFQVHSIIVPIIIPVNMPTATTGSDGDGMQPIIPSRHQYLGTTTPNQHIGVNEDCNHSRELNIVISSCAKPTVALLDQQNTTQLP